MVGCYVYNFIGELSSRWYGLAMKEVCFAKVNYKSKVVANRNLSIIIVINVPDSEQVNT